MKLKTKLLFGFASILVIMVLLFGVSIYKLNLSNQDIENSIQDRYQKIKLSGTVQDELNDISRYLRDLALLDIGSQNFINTVEEIRSSRQIIDSNLDSLNATAVRQTTKDLLNQIRESNLEYSQSQENLIAMISSGNKAEYIKELNLGTSERLQIFNYVDQLNQLEDTSMNDLITSSTQSYSRGLIFFFICFLLALLVGAAITFWLTDRIMWDIRKVTSVMNGFSSLKDHVDLPRLDIQTKDEVGEIAASFNDMARSLEEHAKQEKEFIEKIEIQNWLKSAHAEITALCQGVQDLQVLANVLITKISPILKASYGVFYIREESAEKQYLRKIASYADGPLETVKESFRLGEALVGQSALENRMILLEKVPADYVKIVSGLGNAVPESILVLPVAFEERVVAVIELASLEAFSLIQQELLEVISKDLGVTINRVESHMKIGKLLTESQVLTEELQSQSEELQLQQEELKIFNENMEEQYKQSEKRAAELENVKSALEEKALQFEEISKYKTEFMSNMSHELRTPLNSLLILSQTMAENKEGNLTLRQVEYVKTIFSSGKELLSLINEILDLSKVEAGKITINLTEVNLLNIKDYVQRYFLPVAQQKDLDFTVRFSEDLPQVIYSDEDRILQIIKNLLSNAFKFTEKGSVSLQVQRASDKVIKKKEAFQKAELVVAFSVSDTGIGVSQYQQKIIFEAFQQANGTTARKYGGTGLGLTISQKFAGLLGGLIEIDSVEGKGSTFTLYLPSRPVSEEFPETAYAETAGTCDNSPAGENKAVELLLTVAREVDEVPKVEYGNSRLEGKKILVVDDDMRNVFALTTALENEKINTLFAENGREGIEVLKQNPDIDLVLMDIMMPEMDGYEALQQIRQIPEHADLPIIALTAKAMKNDREKCIQAGASDYISKPINLDRLFSLIKIWLYR